MDLETFEDGRPDLESLDGSQRLGRRSFLIGDFLLLIVER